MRLASLKQGIGKGIGKTKGILRRHPRSAPPGSPSGIRWRTRRAGGTRGQPGAAALASAPGQQPGHRGASCPGAVWLCSRQGGPQAWGSFPLGSRTVGLRTVRSQDAAGGQPLRTRPTLRMSYGTHISRPSAPRAGRSACGRRPGAACRQGGWPGPPLYGVQLAGGEALQSWRYLMADGFAKRQSGAVVPCGAPRGASRGRHAQAAEAAGGGYNARTARPPTPWPALLPAFSALH